ncbi:MAG TPA: hypothetical protein VFX16_11010 [Pseudonocardiaceae bacterium]|nr:hypothetical protein [Pseudonocardiaceae bacterium]
MADSAGTTTPTRRQPQVSTSVRGDATALRRHGFVMTMTALLAGLLISTVAQFAPVVQPALHAAARALWPQGWTFFTGLSTRTFTVGYTLASDGRELTPITQRRSLADRSLGLSRSGDADAFDIAQIAGAVPAAYWQTCAAPEPVDCGPDLDLARAYQVVGVATPPALCGLIVVAKQSARRERALGMAVVDVTCQR